jgi:hypothetical protein
MDFFQKLLEVFLQELILKDEIEFCLDRKIGSTNKTAFQNVTHFRSNISVNCFDIRPTRTSSGLTGPDRNFVSTLKQILCGLR